MNDGPKGDLENHKSLLGGRLGGKKKVTVVPNALGLPYERSAGIGCGGSHYLAELPSQWKKHGGLTLSVRRGPPQKGVHIPGGKRQRKGSERLPFSC